MELLIINGHDYSKYIKARGYNWAREDIDSNKSTRTMDGQLRRVKIATKRKLRYAVMGMSRETMALLDEDLNNQTFRVRYTDLHGEMEREFYCSSFSATLRSTTVDDGDWEAAEFSLIEV